MIFRVLSLAPRRSRKLTHLHDLGNFVIGNVVSIMGAAQMLQFRHHGTYDLFILRSIVTGHLPIDDNPVENTIQPIAGRGQGKLAVCRLRTGWRTGAFSVTHCPALRFGATKSMTNGVSVQSAAGWSVLFHVSTRALHGLPVTLRKDQAAYEPS